MTLGRPTKTLEDLPKDWENMVISLMSEGGSKKEVITELKIGSQLFYEFISRYEEFSNAIKRGEELSESFWEKQGRINLYNKGFNTALWYINMKNRFGWKDKIESTLNGENMVINLVTYHDIKEKK